MSQPLPNQTQLRRDRPVCRRMLLLLFVLLAGFSLVTWRLAVIQIKESPRLAALAAQKYQRHIVLPAHRGAIKDLNGEYLAHDEDVSELYTDRTHLREIITVRHHLAAVRGVRAIELREQLDEAGTLAAYHDHVARVLSGILPLPEKELRAQIASDKPEIVLAKQVDEETAKQWGILFKAEHLFGIHLRPAVARRFPAKDRLSLVLGDTDTGNKGRWGVEKLMDAKLTGTPGEQFIERDKSGHELPAYRGQVVEPQHGNDVHLTIDMQLQDNIEAICERAWKANNARRVVIVVTEPATGTVLAMAARPHRDVSNPDVSTWTNHVIAEPYEPGSIFKVITLAAALDNNKVTPGEKIDCGNMFYEDPVRKVKLSDDEPLGMQTVKGVLVHSSNIGMYKISKRVGQDMMLDYASRFGFGSVTGIGLLGEKAGYMNTGKWSNTTYSRMPIGYEVSVTPLQMCMAYGVIANGGVLMKPRLVDRVVKATGENEITPPQPVWQVCTAKTAASLRDFLEGVVLEGTGSRAAMPEVRVGGKTGTTRRYDPEKKRYIEGSYLTSFIGMAPMEKPQVVCLVMLDDPKAESEKMIRGGRVAAPIFAEVVRETLDHLSIRNERPIKVASKGGAQ
ncbi:penicillin-binding protein 2 [Prosthecobacter sp.]|uniref:peptidoglycan D,D-transpeptidase FtsI family protein n=1 Tax=Prosthecobacter sp. TaxID=1965333 RepID=UPI002ABD0B42|nr:penicillin-binding protein 2 [Prosthecobacter sp.]MDZ4401618.1 penicillin-binding protein 2 [Prosthecobacter sp.]